MRRFALVTIVIAVVLSGCSALTPRNATTLAISSAAFVFRDADGKTLRSVASTEKLATAVRAFETYLGRADSFPASRAYVSWDSHTLTLSGHQGKLSLGTTVRSLNGVTIRGIGNRAVGNSFPMAGSRPRCTTVIGAQPREITVTNAAGEWDHYTTDQPGGRITEVVAGAFQDAC